MLCFRKFTSLVVAFLAGAAILGAPSQAHATFKLFLQEAGVNGGAITEVASGADFTSIQVGFPTAFTYGDFEVKVLSGSSDNAATLSDPLSSTNSVKNVSGSVKTLSIYVSQTNYTLPADPKLSVESGMGGSVNTGTLVLTNIFQAFADKNNTILGMSDYSNGPQNATQTGSTFDTGSASGTFNRTGNFSLTSVATVTLSSGGVINYSNHINVTAPAPAGVLLVLTGLPFLGIGTWLRRGKVKAQNS